MSEHVLEPAAQEFASAAAKPRSCMNSAWAGARKVLEDNK
jgi:hypothetical protein